MFAVNYRVAFMVGTEIVFETTGSKSPAYKGRPFDTLEVLDSAIDSFKRAAADHRAPINALDRATGFIIEDPMTRKPTRYDLDDIAAMRADEDITRRRTTRQP